MNIQEYIAQLERKLEDARRVAAEMGGRYARKGLAAAKPAARRKARAAAKPAKKRKRRMSAAGRARLSALAKARWKKSRALGKSTL